MSAIAGVYQASLSSSTCPIRTKTQAATWQIKKKISPLNMRRSVPALMRKVVENCADKLSLFFRTLKILTSLISLISL